MKIQPFLSARLKLTIWYMLFVLCISGLFSLFIYRQFNFEVKRSLRNHSLRLFPGNQFMQPQSIQNQDNFLFTAEREIYDEMQRRILLQLFIVNSLILFISAFTGYFLAGKTLRPIEEMWDEQRRFIADASHELRTPLTALKTEIEVNLRDNKLSKKEFLEVLKSNLEEVNRMQKLTNYLLTLNNFEVKSEIVKNKISLKDVIETAVNQISAIAESRQIKINTNLSDISIMGNADLLNQLFTILLDNAIKYSQNSTKITITTSVKNKHVSVAFKDEGFGIKRSDLPYIFNRFYRADISRSRTNVEGYGLGLALAKQIVENHNGSITVESQLNKGSTFVVNFGILS